MPKVLTQLRRLHISELYEIEIHKKQEIPPIYSSMPFMFVVLLYPFKNLEVFQRPCIFYHISSNGPIIAEAFEYPGRMKAVPSLLSVAVS